MIRTALFAAITCIVSGTVSAQVADSTVPENGSPNCARPKERGERCFELEIGHTSLFRLEKPFKVLFVGDPAIADAVVQDQYTFLLNTKQREGRTNLIALDEQASMVFRPQLWLLVRQIHCLSAV
jgi:Flp pilus assembly secretin CpaC